LLPGFWDPPGGNAEETLTVQGTGAQVRLTDTDQDGILERVDYVSGPPVLRGQTVFWNGQSLVLADSQGRTDGPPPTEVATQWRLRYNGSIVRVEDQFDNANHIHAAKRQSTNGGHVGACSPGGESLSIDDRWTLSVGSQSITAEPGGIFQIGNIST